LVKAVSGVFVFSRKLATFCFNASFS